MKITRGRVNSVVMRQRVMKVERSLELERNILWTPWDEPGLEHLCLSQDAGQILADGMILRVKESKPFRVHYRIRCDVEWRVREVHVNLLGDAGQNIKLNADGEGRWTDGSGNHILSLDGCFEVDISVTPFTNTLAIRRMRLKPGEACDLVAAYISIPEMEVKPSRQRYTCLETGLEGGIYRYEDEGLFQGFTADLPVDSGGLVADYPALFRRVWAD